MSSLAKVQIDKFELGSVLAAGDAVSIQRQAEQFSTSPSSLLDTGPPRERLNSLQRFLI
jgi:hypothetical protein